MSDPLTDLINDIQQNGIRWVSVITIITLYRKERRTHLLNKRDTALFHNQRMIMDQLGVGDQWKDGPKHGLQPMPPLSLRRLYFLLRKVTKHPKRRVTKMNSQNINYMTLIPTLLAASKIMLQAVGITIPDEGINEVVNGVASLGTAIGIFLPHTKAANVAQTIVKLAPEINTTYKEMFPTIKNVHEGINKLLADVQKNDASQAFNDAASAYLSIMDIIKSIEQPEPLPEIQQESA